MGRCGSQQEPERSGDRQPRADSLGSTSSRETALAAPGVGHLRGPAGAETTCRRRTSLQLRVANVRRMQPRPEGGGIPPAEAHPARRVRAGNAAAWTEVYHRTNAWSSIAAHGKSLVIARSRMEAHCSLRTLVAKRGNASAAQTSRRNSGCNYQLHGDTLMAYLCVSGGNRSGLESRGGGLECPPSKQFTWSTNPDLESGSSWTASRLTAR